MKLGIISQPAPESLEHAKELGLDFVEFDCNPTDFFGLPVEELKARQAAIKEASEKTGVEVGAVGRWASHILDQNGDVIPEEWGERGGCHGLWPVPGGQILPVQRGLREGAVLLQEHHRRHQGAQPDRGRRQRAGHGVRHRQLHDGRQLHPHPRAVEAGPQRSARPGHQVRPFPQLRPRRPPGRLHGRGHGVGLPLQVLPHQGRHPAGASPRSPTPGPSAT